MPARFLSCELWKRCGLARVPEMIPEGDYEKPASWNQPKGNEWKVSFTDAEETAQWLTGEDFIGALFESVLTFKSPDKGPRAFIVHNATSYDGWLEKALVIQPQHGLANKPIACISWVLNPDVLAFVQRTLVSNLVEQWKADKGPLAAHRMEKFKPWDPAAALEEQQLPSLSVCKIIDSKLVLPQEVRRRFLRDPVRSNQWREILGKFDAAYTAAAETTPVTTVVAAPVVPSASTETPDEPSQGALAAPQPAPIDMYSWFPGEPKTLDILKTRYGNNCQFDHLANDKVYFFLVEDSDVKKLFLVAKEPFQMEKLTEYLLGHGAGVWLQSNKATQWFQDNPDKSFVVDWAHDEVQCVLDTNGRDSSIKTLRQVLHSIEHDGHVNFELSGHKLERPPEVISGAATCDKYASSLLPAPQCNMLDS